MANPPNTSPFGNETVSSLAARIKAQYPQYAQVPDHDLVSRITAKFPEYQKALSTEGIAQLAAPSEKPGFAAPPPMPANPSTLQKVEHAAWNAPYNFGSGIGLIPQQASDYLKGPEYMAEHPIQAAKLLGSAFAHSQGSLIKQGYNEIKTPGESAPAGALTMLEGLVPILGPMGMHVGEQVNAKDYSGAVGSAAAMLLPQIKDKVLGDLSPDINLNDVGASMEPRPVAAPPDVTPLLEQIKKLAPAEERPSVRVSPKPKAVPIETHAEPSPVVAEKPATPVVEPEPAPVESVKTAAPATVPQAVEQLKTANSPAADFEKYNGVIQRLQAILDNPNATPKIRADAHDYIEKARAVRDRAAEKLGQPPSEELAPGQTTSTQQGTAFLRKHLYDAYTQAYRKHAEFPKTAEDYVYLGGLEHALSGSRWSDWLAKQPESVRSTNVFAKDIKNINAGGQAEFPEGEKSRIVLNTGIEKPASADDLGMYLAHEAAHISRIAKGRAIESDVPYLERPEELSANRLVEHITGFYDENGGPLKMRDVTKPAPSKEQIFETVQNALKNEPAAPEKGTTVPEKVTPAPEPKPAPADLPDQIWEALRRGKFHSKQASNPDLTEEARAGHTAQLAKVKGQIASKFNEFAKGLPPEHRASLADSLNSQADLAEKQAALVRDTVERMEKNGKLNDTLNEIKAGGGQLVKGQENPNTGRLAGGGHLPYEVNRWSRALMAELTGREERLGQGVDDILPKEAPKVGDPAEWPRAIEFARNMRNQLKQDIQHTFSQLRETEGTDEEAASRLKDQLEEFDNLTNEYFEPKVHEAGVGNRAFKSAGPNGEPAAEFQPVTLDQAQRLMGKKVNKIPSQEDFLARANDLSMRANQLRVFSNGLLARNREAGFASADLFGAPQIAEASRKLGAEIADIAKNAGVAVRQTYNSAADLLMPSHGVARDTLDAMAEFQGDFDRATYLAIATMRAYENYFEHRPAQEGYDFITRLMRGETQPTPELQSIAESVIRPVDSAIGDAVAAARKAHGQDFNFLENHYRVLYKKPPGRTEEGFRNWLNARKPLQGTKGFLRHRVFGDLEEAMKAGGVPISSNPITMFRMGVADSLRYLHAQKLWDWAKDSGARVFVKKGEKIPEGFTRLHDNIAKSFYPKAAGEKLAGRERGEWYVEEGFGRILNNYLSKDHIRQNVLFNKALDLKNLAVSYSLFGPYHAARMLFTSIGTEAFEGANKAYTGIRQANADMVMDGLRDFLKSGAAPARLFREGGNALKYLENKRAFLDSDAGKEFIRQYPGIEALLDDLAHSGIRLDRHPDYVAPTVKNMLEDFRGGRYIHGAIRAPGAMIYRGMEPLFEKYIPRLKIGAFLHDMSNTLAEREDDLASGRVTRTELARQAGARVDNIFGEMNTDRMYLNKTFKSLLQLDYTAASWRMGKALLMKDALTDQFRAVRESIPKMRAARTPKDYLAALPRMSHSLGYILGDLAVTGLAGAAIMKAFTGKNPQNAKDLIHPQIGGVDVHGKPLRITLPTMAGHELESATTKPLSFLAGGQTEILTRLMEDMRNQDFFGKQIRDKDDPAYKQFEDLLFHLVPDNIAVNNMQRLAQAGVTKAEAPVALLGATPTSKRLDMSPAEIEAQDRAATHYEKGPANQREMDTRNLKSQIVIALRNGQSDRAKQLFDAGRQSGALNARSSAELHQRASEPYLKQLIDEPGMTIQDLAQIAKKATPQEKQLMYPVVARRFRELVKYPPAQAAALRTQLRQEFGIASQ